ncbi:hypothetical protein PIB30_089460 [Stylosanthes scabra]|uniref:Leucine-rich repeat-containing N-terminal plant-type domain-containing protein n=1 Tax=Stylosanthes scabra TaxID=79078 RepID=A0ABU6XQX1_9FABA|nr:hypothetical protein [Stylosanthes scabra]
MVQFCYHSLTYLNDLANGSSLWILDIQMNKLHGKVPDTFSPHLEALNVNGNQFEGLLPKTLSSCTRLMDLNLGNNQFEDTFPNWLQNLSYLEILVLRGNKLYGPIVELKSEYKFPSLIIFDISCNNFSGLLPKGYIKGFEAMKILDDKVHDSNYYIQTGGLIDLDRGDFVIPRYDDSVTATIKGANTPFAKIPTVFVNIDLSGNKFEGDIPDVIGELQGIRDLNISHNRLVDHIPHSLGNLTNLESLDLSSNMLTSEIPTELANLNFLEVLNVSQNQLVGSIPHGKQFDAFSNDSYMGNMGLCGLPLSLQCNSNVPQQQYPSSEAEDKFGFGWKPVTIGYACGMVLGISLGCCVFWIGKPQWLVIIFDDERTALLHFKSELSPGSYFDVYKCPRGYPKMRTWDNGTDCCSWMGITCDSMSGHVIGLDLSCSGLVGNIHPNSTLFHLTHLHTLNLAGSDFYGSEFPSQFGEFVSLTHLNLSYCGFDGDIPSQISHLSKLQSLDLSDLNESLKLKETTLKRLLQNATALREILLDGVNMSLIGSSPGPLSKNCIHLEGKIQKQGNYNLKSNIKRHSMQHKIQKYCTFTLQPKP